MVGMGVSIVIIMIVGWFPDVLPVQTVWAACASPLIGGGNAVLVATLYGILTDVVPESERYEVLL